MPYFQSTTIKDLLHVTPLADAISELVSFHCMQTSATLWGSGCPGKALEHRTETGFVASKVIEVNTQHYQICIPLLSKYLWNCYKEQSIIIFYTYLVKIWYNCATFYSNELKDFRGSHLNAHNLLNLCSPELHFFFFIKSEKCEVARSDFDLELLGCGLHFRTARLHSITKSHVTSEQNHMAQQAKLVLCYAHFPFMKPLPLFYRPFSLSPPSHSSSQYSPLSVQKKIHH